MSEERLIIDFASAAQVIFGIESELQGKDFPSHFTVRKNGGEFEVISAQDSESGLFNAIGTLANIALAVCGKTDLASQSQWMMDQIRTYYSLLSNQNP